MKYDALVRGAILPEDLIEKAENYPEHTPTEDELRAENFNKQNGSLFCQLVEIEDLLRRVMHEKQPDGLFLVGRYGCLDVCADKRGLYVRMRDSAGTGALRDSPDTKIYVSPESLAKGHDRSDAAFRFQSELEHRIRGLLE